MFPSSHPSASSTLKRLSRKSSRARWPVAIDFTPPVYQILDSPVTPAIYLFPFFTALDIDQLRELFNQTSGNLKPLIVFRDTEAMQSTATKLGVVDEGKKQKE